tara:strand:+ start:795 stop:1430 length:636 start_codon:yes stop_codon:yes gene_type:complete
MKKYNFKKDGFTVIKKVIDPKIADFVYTYFLMKAEVTQTFFNTKYISPFEQSWGLLGDEQCPKAYAHYADIAMETLLLQALPAVEKHTKLKLIPTYSYARVYTHGDELKRHKDRFSCEVSASVNLGGDLWPIYIDPTGKPGQAGIKVGLTPGDMLIYKGDKSEHWREKFNGTKCVQVFLHYNSKTSGAKDNIFDGRPHLGLPLWFKGFKFT